MPREITHWKILEDSVCNIKQEDLKHALNANLDFCYIGAIFHDIFFYGQKDFSTVSDVIHGTKGEDTFKIMKIFTEDSKEGINDQLLSFIYGLYSHIITDCKFHPFIYHFTGDYYSSSKVNRSLAELRHRQIETLLDLYFSETYYDFKKYDIQSYFYKFNLIEDYIISKLNKEMFADIPSQIFLKKYKKAKANYLTLYKIMRFRCVDKLQELVFNKTTLGLKKILALFYYPNGFTKARNLSFGETYKNPVTGRNHNLNLKELFHESSNKIALFPEIIKKDVNNAKTLLYLDKGPSLTNGLIGEPVESATFFEIIENL